jgi:hypothetical protein
MSDLTPSSGPVIVTKYVGWSNTFGARIVATHKRDYETVWRHIHTMHDNLSDEENHRKAAEGLLATWGYVASLKIVGHGRDADNHYFLCQGATLSLATVT